MGLENIMPAIRFVGFREDWEQKSLGELTDYKNGKGHEDKQKKIGVYELVNLNSIAINGGLKPSGKFVDETDSTLNKNDLVMVLSDVAHGNLLGRVALIPTNNTYVLNQRVALLRPKLKISPLFVLYNINAKQHYFKSQGAGMSQLNLSRGSVESFETYIPKRSEQNKIGNYFQQLDTLIAQHQKKHKKLLNLKKALLEKMFPKQGETEPAIRFKSFSREWEEREIQEVSDKYDNLRVPITAKDRIAGITPYYGANGIQDYVEGYTHEGEFILVAEDGANDLKNYPVQYVNGKVWVNNHAHVLQTKNNVADNYFLKISISQTNIEPFLVGGGRAKLNAVVMMEMLINIPYEITEQAKIGNLFKQLDTLISQQQVQLKKLGHIKLAFLDKMFV